MEAIPGPSLIAQIASYGLPGLIVAVMIVAYWHKDRELRRESEARIADAKNYLDLALKLQAQVLTNIEKLSDIFNAIRDRDRK